MDKKLINEIFQSNTAQSSLLKNFSPKTRVTLIHYLLSLNIMKCNENKKTKFSLILFLIHFYLNVIRYLLTVILPDK